MYQTRRDWLIAELILGIVSIATGLASLQPGGVLASLMQSANVGVISWFLIFVITGAMLIATAVAELFRRVQGASRNELCRYAQCRMWWHFFNGLCWLYAFTTLLQLYMEQNIFIASILFQSLPLLAVNIWGVFEHAKALWFEVSKAGTSSLVRATYDRLRDGSRAAQPPTSGSY